MLYLHSGRNSWVDKVIQAILFPFVLVLGGVGIVLGTILQFLWMGMAGVIAVLLGGADRRRGE